MKSPNAPSSCELEWERNLPEHARSVALKVAAVLGLSLSLPSSLSLWSLDFVLHELP